MPFNVSTFSRLTDTVAQIHPGYDWSGLVEAIGQHRPAVKKDDVPLFAPAEWHPGHGPSKKEGTKYLVGVHFGCFDFDDVHESALPTVLGALEAGGIAHVVLSTWSHTGRRKKADASYKDKAGNLIPALPGVYYQLRVLFPFSRMVLPSEWSQLWPALNVRLFGSLSDDGCKDPTHRYYAPAYKEGAGVSPIYASRPGGALDVDAFLAVLGPPPKEAAPTQVAALKASITLHDVKRIARALKASKTKKDVGEALAALANGEAYAPSGQRTPITYKMVREILDRHPGATHEAVAALWGPSIQAMQPTKMTRERILEMCANKEPNAIKIDHTTRVAEAFNGARGEAYAPEDIEAMAEALEYRPDELARRWIIQKGSSYYVLCDGQYRCYTEQDVQNAVLRDLAPAATVGVDLHEVTQRGMRRKTIAELMELYGTVANEVVIDLAAQKARYDSVTRTFVEAPCPIRVTPKYDADVEKWLTLLVGEAKAPKLFDWLASVTKLDEPCAAIYFEGKGGTGKSLFAHGVARIFTDDRPVMLSEVLGGTYNESATKCPVILADETVPTDHQGRIKSAEIREFIQARTRPLSRKYKPTATLKGALRLVIAANNRGLLDTNEHLTEYDIAAFAERFLFLPVQEIAREFLESQPGIATRWIEQDAIARHALWLAENWEIDRTGRLIVSGDSQELVSSLTTQTGLRASVCQWIANFLLRPSMFMNQYAREGLITTDGARLFVTPRALHEAWTMYLQDKGTPPTPTAIARALAGLSKEAFVHRGSKTVRVRDFDLRALLQWAQVTGYLDESAIRDALVQVFKATAVPAVLQGGVN